MCKESSSLRGRKKKQREERPQKGKEAARA